MSSDVSDVFELFDGSGGVEVFSGMCEGDNQTLHLRRDTVPDPAIKPIRITPRAAANILINAGVQCSHDKITRWCREKRLKKARRIGGHWYVDEAEVREMVE